MTIVTDKGTFPERLDWTYDNRDPGETWLQLEGTGDYISVQPTGVMYNMLENCYNEDVSFLFHQFCEYLNYIDREDIKEDTETDHIAGFAKYLNNLMRR